jgi:hypothetical protein
MLLLFLLLVNFQFIYFICTFLIRFQFLFFILLFGLFPFPLLFALIDPSLLPPSAMTDATQQALSAAHQFAVRFFKMQREDAAMLHLFYAPAAVLSLTAPAPAGDAKKPQHSLALSGIDAIRGHFSTINLAELDCRTVVAVLAGQFVHGRTDALLIAVHGTVHVVARHQQHVFTRTFIVEKDANGAYLITNDAVLFGDAAAASSVFFASEKAVHADKTADAHSHTHTAPAHKKEEGKKDEKKHHEGAAGAAVATKDEGKKEEKKHHEGAGAVAKEGEKKEEKKHTEGKDDKVKPKKDEKKDASATYVDFPTFLRVYLPIHILMSGIMR